MNLNPDEQNEHEEDEPKGIMSIDGFYGDLVDETVTERAKVEGAKMAKDAWDEMLSPTSGAALYASIVENGPLLPEYIVSRIGAQRIQETAKVLLEIDMLSLGQWSQIEAVRTCHAGLVVLLTLAEIARECEGGE